MKQRSRSAAPCPASSRIWSSGTRPSHRRRRGGGFLSQRCGGRPGDNATRLNRPVAAHVSGLISTDVHCSVNDHPHCLIQPPPSWISMSERQSFRHPHLKLSFIRLPRLRRVQQTIHDRDATRGAGGDRDHILPLIGTNSRAQRRRSFWPHCPRRFTRLVSRERRQAVSYVRQRTGTSASGT